jgi:WD40 repeat protein
MLKLRRVLPLLAAAALAACAVVMSGCGGTDSRKSALGRRDGHPPAWRPCSVCVHQLALSPDGRRLLTSYRVENPEPVFEPYRTLSLWDTQTGKELWGRRGGKPVTRLCWLPDGRHFLVSRSGERLALWDADKGAPVRDFGDGTEGEQVLAVSADGRRALLAGGELRVCSLPRGETVCFLGGANGWAISGHLSADGKWALASFAAYHGSDAMALWEVGKLQPARVWGEGSHWSWGPFSPDGKHFLPHVRVPERGFSKTYAVLQEVRTGKELWRVADWEAYQFTPDGKQILVQRDGSGGPGVFGRLDATTGKLLWETGPLTDDILSVSFSPDGNLAAASTGYIGLSGVSPGIRIHLWDATTGKHLRRWQVPEDPPPPLPAGKP